MRYKYGSKKRKPTPLLILDRVERHLLRQMRQARRSDSAACAYRTPDGLMCAVGCLISEAHYRPSLEGVICLRLCDAIEKSIGRDVTGQVGLLERLQRIHDNTKPTSWRRSLRVVRREVEAGKYGEV